MHDPTSVDHQSSFVEKWWLLTGKLVVFSRLFYYKKIKKCELSYGLRLLINNLHLLKIVGFEQS